MTNAETGREIVIALAKYTGVEQGANWTFDMGILNVYAARTDDGRDFYLRRTASGWNINEVTFDEWPPPITEEEV